MKYITTIFCFIISTLSVKSQSNLQFSRVINFGGSIAPRSEVILDTVPSGKVWKIEATGFSPKGGSTYFKINGNMYTNFMIFSNWTAPVSIKETIWLNAGDYISYQTTDQNPYAGYDTYFVSILEFNVTQ